jgi:ribonuclease PH
LSKVYLRRKLRLESQRKRKLKSRIPLKKVSQKRRKHLNLKRQILNKKKSLKMIQRRLKNLLIKMVNLKPFPKPSLPHQLLQSLKIQRSQKSQK